MLYSLLSVDQLVNTEMEFTFIRYEENWVNDTKWGYGLLTFSDNSKYEGHFRANYKHRLGKLMSSDATKSGLFSYGKLIKEEDFQI